MCHSRLEEWSAHQSTGSCSLPDVQNGSLFGGQHSLLPICSTEFGVVCRMLYASVLCQDFLVTNCLSCSSKIRSPTFCTRRQAGACGADAGIPKSSCEQEGRLSVSRSTSASCSFSIGSECSWTCSLGHIQLSLLLDLHLTRRSRRSLWEKCCCWCCCSSGSEL